MNGLQSRALRAQPENFDGVFHRGEAVLGGSPRGPGLDRGRLDFNSLAAAAAQQVVMMAGDGAAPVHCLAVRIPEDVHQTLISEGLQDPV